MEGNNVLRINGNRLAARKTKVGLRNWEFVEVLFGLNEGEKIAASLDRVEVKDGALVTVRQTSSSAYSTQTTTTLSIGGVSAGFNVTTQPPPPTYTLTVITAGTGSGTVISSPLGINCGSDCVEPYNSGQIVVLTPTAYSGSVFAGWSGACTGTGTGTCTVTMNASKSVT